MKLLAFASLLAACGPRAGALETPRDEPPRAVPATEPAPVTEAATATEDPAAQDADEAIVRAWLESLDHEDPCSGHPCIGMVRSPTEPAWRSWKRVPAATIAPPGGAAPPAPTEDALAEIADAPGGRATVTVELCVDEAGGVVHASLLDDSGSPTWTDQIAHWVTTPAFRPYEVDGVPEPVCAELVFEHRAP